MKWFDKEEIKFKKKLTSSQLDYLQKPSLVICGPFNCLIHRHLDFFIVIAFLNICGFLLSKHLPQNSFIYFYSIINTLLILGVDFFFVKHGRRLAWNRNQWENFGDFQNSQRKCYLWAWVGIIFSEITLIRGSLEYILISDNILADLFLTIFPFPIAISLPFIMEWYKNREKLSNDMKNNPSCEAAKK